MIVLRPLIAILLAGSLAGEAGRQGSGDSALRAAVERFFATQESEDAEGYLALWSAKGQRPTPQQLKFVFDSGDDKFSDIAILKVTSSGEQTRVRVAAVRNRTEKNPLPERPPISRRSQMDVSLTFVREGEEWKLIREGPAVDDLAIALVEAANGEERQRLLAEQPDLLNTRLLMAIARRGVDAARDGKYDVAEMAYTRMLELARDLNEDRFAGEALQNLGNTYYFKRDFSRALQAYEQRLTIERRRGDDEGIAAALGGVATIRYTLAEYGPALAAYRQTLAIQELLRDEPGLATTLISTGNILFLQGDFDAAIADYRRSRELHRKNLNTQGEADALEGLGRVSMARADYGSALEAFTAVLAEGRARANPRAQGTALLNIGEVHFRLGNLETARSTFEESRGHFESLKDTPNVGRVWQAIALTDLVAGNFTTAEAEYRKSIDSCVTATDQECIAGATVGLGFAQTAQDKYIDAIASYKRAVEAFSRLKRTEQAARAEVGLSQALTGNEDYVAAREAAASARQRAVGIANDDVLWRALLAEARALRRLNEGEAALGAANAARLAVTRIIEGTAVRPATSLPRDSWSVFALLAVLHAERQDAAAAFEAAEQMRAHTLRLLLAPAEREIVRGMTDAEKAEERAAAVELISLHAQLRREQTLPKPDAARIEKLQEAVKAAEETRGAQQQQLFDRLPDLRVWRGLVNAAARDDVRFVLTDPETTLAEFVVDEEDLLLISARMGEDGPQFTARLDSVPRRALADAIARLITADNLTSVDKWRKALRELPGPVLTTLAKVGAGSRVVLVPHEILWRVPFEAIADDRRDSPAIIYAPSVTALVRAPDSERQHQESSRVLLAAAPAIAPDVRERLSQTVPLWSLRPDADADREVKAIVAVLDPPRTTAVRGPEISESALRELLPETETIHIAAPFRINGASPLFSPIVVAEEKFAVARAGQPDTASDGTLDAREIMNMHLTARVAVLSDGGAMAMRDAADDAEMIAWAWRAAGVPYLLMSRWTADAESSDRLLAELHRRLRAGDSPADALRAAQTAARRRGAATAPYDWAGWLLVSGR